MATVFTDMTISPEVVLPVAPPERSVADLLEQLGDVPPQRVRMVPCPGTATELGLLEARARGGRVCELIDGTLVEKTLGFYEARVATRVSFHIELHLQKARSGITVVGGDAYMRLFPGRVRVPDVAYVARERLPGGHVPRGPIANFGPDLAVEVLSESNTRGEMSRKLQDYFAGGSQLVWYIDPKTRTAEAYTTPERHTEIGEDGVLSGGQVLPGFELSLRQLFAEADEV